MKNDKSKTILSIYWGSFLLGTAIGYLIGNSNTSVSGIAISSMLGFFGSVMAAILKNSAEIKKEGKYTNKEVDLRIIGFIFIWFASGMILGTLSGQCMRGLYYSAVKNSDKKWLFKIPPISHRIDNP